MARNSTIGTVYLLHFDRPLAHAQHYCGWAVDADDRIDAHLAGEGSRLVAAAVAAGIHVEVVKLWDDVDRSFERKLKRRNNFKGLCPICKVEYNRRAAAAMRRRRALARLANQEVNCVDDKLFRDRMQDSDRFDQDGVSQALAHAPP